jgi:phosphatidylserine/phosphatidylglycerophosphate/cardiolipin synthase-like enzyme
MLAVADDRSLELSLELSLEPSLESSWAPRKPLTPSLATPSLGLPVPVPVPVPVPASDTMARTTRSSVLQWTSVATALLPALLLSSPQAFAQSASRVEAASVDSPPAIESAFSPNEGALGLIMRTIQSAQKEIRVMAYSFTSADVVRALLAARKRGVDVVVVADKKANVAQDQYGKSRAAFNALISAGAKVYVIDAYAISHDKVLIVDRVTVQTGSYNYSEAAAKRNSENVLVVRNNPRLAQSYLRHFERNLAQAKPFTPSY